jgi:competence protein ComEC
VLKVPHHGSRYQDPDLLTGLGARLAVVSVGAENDYGHPAGSTLALLRHAGMTVERTDRDGDVAVVVRDGRLWVRTRGGR